MNADADLKRRLQFADKPFIQTIEPLEHRQRTTQSSFRTRLFLSIQSEQGHQTVPGKVGIISPEPSTASANAANKEFNRKRRHTAIVFRPVKSNREYQQTK
jgi:hypothetical protein